MAAAADAHAATRATRGLVLPDAVITQLTCRPRGRLREHMWRRCRLAHAQLSLLRACPYFSKTNYFS